MDCIFCKIIQGDIPAEKIYEDDEILAFNDIHPQAPTHVLIIPKRHIARVSDLTPEDAGIAGRLILVASDLARQEGVAQEGYRLVFNCGEGAGQEVEHIHLHLLGGRAMLWPPG